MRSIFKKMDGRVLMRHRREIIYLFITMLIILTLVQTASAQQSHSMNMVRGALTLAYLPMQEEGYDKVLDEVRAWKVPIDRDSYQ